MNSNTVSRGELVQYITHLSAQRSGGQYDNLNYNQGMLDLGATIVPNTGTLTTDANDLRGDVFGSQVAPAQLSVAQVTTTLVITRNGAVSLATADRVLVTVGSTTYNLTSGLTAAAASVTIAGIVAATAAGNVVEVAVMDGAVPLATWTGSVAIS